MRWISSTWIGSMAPRRPRSIASVVGFFSAAALFLAALGIYGVLSYSVAQRRREMGIRLALGAQTSQIRALVVRQSLKLVAAGILLGVPVAVALARLSTALLAGITPTDPATVCAVVVVVFAVGVAAAYLPARRATAIDPVRVLSEE